MDPTCSFLDRYRDHGLLLIRVGVGVLFMMHGWPKITGGVETWEKVGGAIGVFGIGFAPVFWGFMAAFSEFFGGLLLAVGLFSRGAAFLLFCTMVTASTMHITGGDGFERFSHPLKLVFVFGGLMLAGPGRFSIDAGLSKTLSSRSGPEPPQSV
ncbi:MAG: DoxX family protein [Candidatus Glassbacteria bacterium]|nr:DoxX family protein [Candidatus Glassbacteria bacterium]